MQLIGREHLENDTNQPAGVQTKYKTIFISDIHIGSAGCLADDCLRFLKENSAQQYYLVGDILDLKLLGKGLRWNKHNNNLLRWILKKSNKSTVIYIPGNHDEEFRELGDTSLGGIQVKLTDIYTAVDGKRYYITHGDEADSVVSLHPKIAMIGSIAYELLIILNIQVNRLRSVLRLKHWSFSEFIKHRVKDAIKYVTHFEDIIISKTKEFNCDGVVTGHIHTPACKIISGVLYLNCGDWISNRSAIVEHHDGRMELIYLTD